MCEQSGDGTEEWQVVEAGTGGKTLGTFDTKAEAREYVEDRFGESPSPAVGRTVWKGEKRPGRSRYIIQLRKVHAATDPAE
jgi:hypothetical protein